MPRDDVGRCDRLALPSNSRPFHQAEHTTVQHNTTQHNTTRENEGPGGSVPGTRKRVLHRMSPSS